MRNVLTDLRYAMRMLRKNPGFTAVAVIALGLGIGANTAIFSVINSVLLRPLEYHDPDRLVMIWEKNARGNPRNVISPANYLDWKAQNSVFSDIAAFVFFAVPFTLSGTGDPLEVRVQLVTASFFSVVGVQPEHGRAILPEEDRPNVSRAAVISHGLWQRQFGGNPSLIGDTITLNGNNYTVVGIMPPNFHFMFRDAEIWAPVQLDPARDYRKTSGRYMTAVARLKPGVALEQARVQMDTIAERLSQTYPDFNKNWGANLVSVEEQIVGDVRRPLLVLLAAVGFVLLIACANVANLLLARAASRQKEIAIRTSLGAGRWRLARQLLTESIALAVLGGAAGLLLAKWGVDALIAASPADLPRVSEIGLDSTVLAFTVAVSLVTGIVFGLAPSFAASRGGLSPGLQEASRGNSGGLASRRIRSGLVIAEIALSLILLTGAGLLIHSFAKLQSVDPGFRSENLISFKVVAPRLSGEDNGRSTRFFQHAVERFSSLPAVRSASATNFLPFGGIGSATGMVIEGRPEPPPGEMPTTDVRVVMPGYFQTMGIPLLRGREFEERDNTRETPLRFVVNQSFASEFFPNEEVLGKRISVHMARENPMGEIIGVVGDMQDTALDKKAAATAYYPHAYLSTGSMVMLVRADQTPALLAELRNTVRALNPSQPVPEFRSMELVMADTLTRPRFYMLLLVLFAGVAVTLAGIGIYGVISYSVTQRTHEIGLRMALGAQQAHVLKLVVGDGAVLAAAGIAIGLLAGLAVTRTMAALLFEVEPHDPLTYAAVAAALAVVTLLAAYIPARRAARVDPMVALRHE